MKAIRIAIIGAGYINDYHVRGLQPLPDVEVVAVGSAHLEKAQQFATRHAIGEAVTDIHSLATREDIDAVVMGVPNRYHASYTIEFLKSGKDVFQEKPLAMNAKEGEEIISVAEASGGIVMVGHMWRFDEEAMYIRDMVRSDQIGKVIRTKGYGIHVNWGPTGWFAQKSLAGGGALADMGVHAIDTVRFILDDPQPKQVYASIGTHYGEYDVDDTGLVVITWDDGVVSTIECGWWQPHMDGPEAGTRLYGTRGYASLFPTLLKVETGGTRGKLMPEFPERKEHCDQAMYDRQMKSFVHCIRTRQTPKPGLAEGQAIMKIVDAAYASSASGEVIRF